MRPEDGVLGERVARDPGAGVGNPEVDPAESFDCRVDDGTYCRFCPHIG
jgi:hypothetical protein